MADLIRTHPGKTALALADLGVAIYEAPLEPPIEAQLVRIVRDSLAVILAGARAPENAALARLVPSLGPGEAQVIGSAYRALPHIAALVNATAGISVEMSEGNQFAGNHPAMHILPALLAVAEENGASGDSFLRAFFAGYEVAARVGRAMRLRDHVHPFGTTMVAGVALAVALLQGFDRTQTAQAIAVAVNLSVASSQEAANAGASVRNLCTGMTAHNGLLATRFVAAGFCGAPEALETVFGRILGERFDIGDMAGTDTAYVLSNYFKIHACSRWNHAPIEATEAIMAAGPVPVDAIEQVTVWTFGLATRLNETRVANAYAGKHSIPFNVALRLLHGGNGPELYTDTVALEPAMVELTARVSVREDPALSALLPDVRAARVEISLRSGETLMAECRRPRGGFDNPLPNSVLEAKFTALAGRSLDPERVAALFDEIGTLPAARNVRRIVELGSPERLSA